MKPDFISDEMYNLEFTRHCLPVFYIDNILPSSFIGRCERNGDKVPYKIGKQKTNPGKPCKLYKVCDVIEKAASMGLAVTQSKDIKSSDAHHKKVFNQVNCLTEEKNYLEYKIKQMKEEIDRLEPICMASKNMGFALPSYKRIITNCVSIEDGIACGVYFLIKSDEVVYVGQSLNVYARVQQHKREGVKDFDSFSFLQCDESALNKVEQMYIKFLDPEYNVTYSPSNQSFISKSCEGWL